MKKSSVPWKEAFSPESCHGGTCIRGLRTREGITQKTLAEQLGVSVVALRKMEQGKATIPQEVAAKLEKLYKTPKSLYL